jgi:hypothetical protein|tara:strand:- start:978 stop:1445 length:468 start_codon:yes stop_codon:yes gene_type:complete
MIKQISIFDLDGTTIDSSHRQVTLPNGNLDIANWLENSTPSKIFADKVLPLSLQIRRRQKKGDYVVVHTARNMSYADYEFLMENGICPNKIISRPIGNNTADGVLKRKQLSSLFNLKPFKQARKVMFDDNLEVKKEVSKIGVQVFNPNKLNERLK